MSDVEAVTQEEVIYCTVHTHVEATLRCNKCNRPMCIRCAVRTPVGYRCKQCVHQQQEVFFTGTTRDYVIAGVAAFVVSAVAGGVLLYIGSGFWLLTILLSAPAGGLISEVVWRAVGKRRSRYLWLVVGLATVLGVLPIMILWWVQMGVFPSWNLLSVGLYVVLAGGTAVARFRFGRRLW